MTHPLQISFDPAKQLYLVDHPKRRKLNIIKVFALKAPGLDYKDVRTTRSMGRGAYFDRDKEIIYLDPEEFATSQAYWTKLEKSDIQRYFVGLLKRCGLASWIDAVS